MRDPAPLPDDPRRRMLAAAWLKLGVAGLAFAGLYALLLVVARTPGIGALVPVADLFRTALVVHVDLSVLLWFLAMTALLWGVTLPPAPFERTSFALALGGTVIIALSPFAGNAVPVISNYVPVLDQPFFLGGLALLAAAFLLRTLAGLPALRLWHSAGRDPIQFGALTLLPLLLLAGVSLVASLAALAPREAVVGYFELLFWGPGHLLQIAYAQLMVVAWLLLAARLGLPLPWPPAITRLLLVLGALPALAGPLIHFAYAPDAAEFRPLFTRLMVWGGGVAAVPIGLALLLALVRRGRFADDAARPLAGALGASIGLFAVGGLLGAAIRGSNTVVPAHYHGAIVGVTLALMGLAYLLLPRLGCGMVVGRLAGAQPWIYAGGQLLHIGGLAAAGVLGIERKTAGTAQRLESVVTQAMMGVMGLGGLIAIVGGLLFVVVAIAALRRRPDAVDSAPRPPHL